MFFITKGTIMRAIITLLILAAVTLSAALIPSKSYTTITAVNGNRVTLQNPIGINGESALVVRTLASGEFATAYIMQTSDNKAYLIDNDPVDGGHLANIKPTLKVGDRVIGGFLYDKVIILAPNRETFNKVQANYGINSIDPDTFAAYLKANNQSPSRSAYKKFAKMVGVGLFIIAKSNTIEVYDPISQKTLSKSSFNRVGTKNIKPFYNTFSE